VPVEYDPAERRLGSMKGGADVIPLPIWLGNSFNVYGTRHIMHDIRKPHWWTLQKCSVCGCV
jgi:hypothetical protein